jgi:TonB family protein
MPSTTFLLVYAAQLAIAAGVTALVLAAGARHAPALRLAAWRSVIAGAWLLPLTALLPETTAAGPVHDAPATAVGLVAFETARATAYATPPDWASWIVGVAVAGALIRIAWIIAVVIVMSRRLDRVSPAQLPEFDALRDSLGVEARLVWRDDVAHPFTFGDRPASVVLPAWTRHARTDLLRAMLTHELLHAARRDWRWLLTEECALAPLWWHPVSWLARRELRQAREEIVDRATVARTGSRRRYVELLMTLAERRPAALALSVPVFTQRQLPRRVAALVSEVRMSRTRVALVALSVAATATASLAAASRVLPLPAAGWSASSAAQPASTPGPLEQKAYAAPRDAAPPSRLAYVAPQPPPSVPITEEIDVELRLVLDTTGRVAEARAASIRGVTGGAADAVAAAALAAARKWRFAPPSAAPLAMTTTLTLEPSNVAGGPPFSTRERPIPVQLIAASYPREDERAGTEGLAEVEVTIDAEGHVSGTRVIKATTPAMGEAAAVALGQSTFVPGMRDGTPVPVTVTIAVRFALK